MKVIYIAGPFRGKSAWDIECNIRRAETLALEVWRFGCAALCPHTNTRFFQGAAEDAIWLDGGIELLRRCDAVLLVEGWENSSGTCEEIIAAVDAGIPVFASMNRLAIWIYHETIAEVQQEIKAKAVQCRDARRAKAGA